MRAAPAAPTVQAFGCTQCGAALEIRAPGRSLVIACGHCGSVLDARDPKHQVLAAYEGRIKCKPRIPLGTRGKLHGELYEAIGFLLRKVTVEGVDYGWREYLLWNPRKGYRFLSEYAHHWLYLKPCTGIPKKRGVTVEYLDRTYRKFQTAEATTTYVLGEFYWQAARGEVVEGIDWVSPPHLLSEERADNEVNWTIGEYIAPETIWKAFNLPGAPPVPEGVAPAQPSPYEAYRKPMLTALCVALTALFGVQALLYLGAANKKVHEETFVVQPTDPERSRVTREFQIGGRSTNVAIDVTADVDNNWAWFDFALIHPATETAYDAGVEVDFWHGVESGHSWSEGSRTGRTFLSGVPAGEYYLRVEPESPATTMSYTVTVRRDVPRWFWFWIALGAVVLPYLWFVYAARNFEFARWFESDYPMEPLINLESDD